MKTVGVIGGVGPQATMDFERRFHQVAQARIPPAFNTGYPPLAVLYVRRPPALLEDGAGAHRPRQPLTPDPTLLEAARRLGTIADFLVITSNFTHVFRREVEQASGRPVLSMIDLVIDELGARQWTNVGVLGVGQPRIYTEPLDARGIRHETLAEDEREALDGAILALLEGREGDAERAVAQQAVATLRARWVEGTILGCTEIPLLLGDAADGPDLIHPIQLLAEAAVAKAIG
jgi:aspartate racemase